MEGGSSSSSSDRYAERCALAAELARVLDTVRQLEAHMGGPADDGGERCRALVSSMRSSVDRSIRIAMSCCVVTGAPESPPSADGSPRSGGGLDDHAADVSRCRAANAGGQSKKRYGVITRHLFWNGGTALDPWLLRNSWFFIELVVAKTKQKMQEDASPVEHAGEGELRAGCHPPRGPLQLEEVRPEGHPRRQVPKVPNPPRVSS